MSNAVDLAKVINESRVSGYQWMVFITCWLVAFLDSIDLQAIALAAPALAQEWEMASGEFGPVFTAGPLGMALGAMLLGSLGDWFGRKWLIIIATGIFGFLMLLTAFSPNLEVMVVLRFLTGLGLGGVLPNLLALISEYAPDRKRATAMMITFSSLPLGAVGGGLLGAWIIPIYGWQSIFYIGGIVPILVALYLPFKLPESIRFLAARGRPEDRAKIARVMMRMLPERNFSLQTEFTIPEAIGVKPSVREIFGTGRTASTLVLTLASVFAIFTLYFLLSWLPTIMIEAGLDLQSALLTTAAFGVGGVIACLLIWPLADRFDPFVVIAITFMIGVVAITGLRSTEPLLLIPSLLLTGIGVAGAQIGIYLLVAVLYPTRLRGTGGGFALGVGRIGSILGPATGGLAFALGLPITTIFLLAAVPGLVSAVLMWLMLKLPRNFGQAEDAV